MGIKYGTTNMTVVKWGTSSLSTVYYGSTKVFPDQAYHELDISLSFDNQERDFRLYIDNPNNFSVDIDCEAY